MKHVPLSWLRRFQFALLALDAVVLGFYLYGVLAGDPASQHAVEGLHSHNQAGTTAPLFGVSVLIASLAGFHALYTLGITWWLDKRRTWLVHAVGVLTSGSILVLLANSDSPIHLVHHVMLMCFVFLATMAGTLVAGVTVALAFIFLIITSVGASHLTADPAGHIVEMILVNLSAISAVGGWFIFNKYYVQKTDPKVVESLTRLVDRERTTVSLILESITDGVMIIDTDGIVRILNASSAKMLGWTKEEARNLQYTSLLLAAGAPGKSPMPATQPSESLAIAKTFESSKPEQQVSLFKTRDGRQIYLDITASPLIQGGEAADAGQKVVGVIAVLRDVDKQKREEEQRSEFISTASHEMRTPVAAIEGYLALALNNKVSTIDAKARSYIEKAHSSTQHLGKLFQDLLTSARAEDGRLVSHPQVIEMGHYLEQLVETLRFSAEKKGLLMDFTVGASTTEQNTAVTGKIIKPLYYTHADPDRMREVITNLFDNAVKYTETGKISLGLTGNTEIVQMFVKDTGPGIPAADISHLFQKFYRVDNSATRTIGGTGLGLFISRKIVELYKGRVWVESEFGKGSTFYINLPRLANQKADELLRSEQATAQSASPLDRPAAS
ncbi:MAG TPA: ATP-binding protein [Candidatus Limnocylindria bacterium]|nr:ATP-binding protein [Candidatus Limnocylindria bacterium]